MGRVDILKKYQKYVLPIIYVVNEVDSHPGKLTFSGYFSGQTSFGESLSPAGWGKVIFSLCVSVHRGEGIIYLSAGRGVPTFQLTGWGYLPASWWGEGCYLSSSRWEGVTYLPANGRGLPTFQPTGGGPKMPGGYLILVPPARVATPWSG